ncbi:MAG: hypothetical protein NC432_13880 [Roseburia sp.]|nr:hypothetical protein [Roseburia sp.]MCM1096545.1 hypothetical protein [Ruminococcus flavefaciens]
MTENMDIGYVFRQLEEIQKQTGYLSEALAALKQMPESDSGEPGSPGNIAEQEIARSIGDIVRCRETTNQKLIEFYGMVYRDLRGKPEEGADAQGSAEKKQDSADFSGFEQKGTRGVSLADLVSTSKAFAAQMAQMGKDIGQQVGNDIVVQVGNDIASQVSSDAAEQEG